MTAEERTVEHLLPEWPKTYPSAEYDEVLAYRMGGIDRRRGEYLRRLPQRLHANDRLRLCYWHGWATEEQRCPWLLNEDRDSAVAIRPRGE